jgi:thiopurine S-methyltransferase
MTSTSPSTTTSPTLDTDNSDRPDIQDPRSFWTQRWARGEIGWHQEAPEPRMVREFEKMGVQFRRVFVPLCGKSLDLLWLAQQGLEVIGAEWSAQACKEFFEEHRIPFIIEESLGATRFRSTDPALRVQLLQGDFFSLSSEQVGSIDVVYDRAAMIALAPQLREAYVKHLQKIARTSGGQLSRLFIITIERPDGGGPPYSVPADEIQSHYSKAFQIQVGPRESTTLRGNVAGFEVEYRLTPISACADSSTVD